MPISHYIGAIPFALLFLFFAVATIKLLVVLAKAQFLKRKLMKTRRSNKSFSVLLEKLQLTNRAYLIESNKQFAFCLGMRSPKIYVSTSLIKLLNTKEIEAVLLHEKYHMDNRDTLTMLIASIGESLLPFFPLLSDFLHNYRVEREIKADQEAILGLGDEKPLIAVLKKMLGKPSLAMVSVAAMADQDTLEPRILTLTKKGIHIKKFKRKHVVISIFSAIIMGTVVLSPVQAFEVHHEGQDVMMLCPSGSMCMNACKQEYSTSAEDHSEDMLYSSMR